jgi:hypothetical protein
MIVADLDNPSVGDDATLAELTRLPWATAFARPGQVPVGVDPRDWGAITAGIQVVVDSLADLPLYVRGTNRVALVQERLIKTLGTDVGLRLMEPPFPVAPIRLAFWWHWAFDADPEHAWFRGQLALFDNGEPLRRPHRPGR